MTVIPTICFHFPLLVFSALFLLYIVYVYSLPLLPLNPSNFCVIMAASASSFSATKILQPLNSTRSIDSNNKTPLGNQLKGSSFFLGSAKKLYKNKPFSFQSLQRRSKGVLAVSEVVKDKKLSIDSSLSNLVLAFFKNFS